MQHLMNGEQIFLSTVERSRSRACRCYVVGCKEVDGARQTQETVNC